MTLDVALVKDIIAKAECLHDMTAINKALDNMANEITKTLGKANPIVICVMTGAVVAIGHLLTRLHFPLQVDYIHATRYRGSIRGGDLHWLVEPRLDLNGRNVLIIDDIMDGGLTISAIMDYCKQAGAQGIYSAVMVNKIREREAGVDFEPDFIGVSTENRFLIGFGLDYEEYFRNLPGIYAVAEEHQ
jgi:hypoxanthine phosphoribosyltransferase